MGDAKRTPHRQKVRTAGSRRGGSDSRTERNNKGGKDEVRPTLPGNRMTELQRVKGTTPDRGLRSLRNQKIEYDEFEWFALRNELGAAQLKRIKQDPWRGKAYEIHASTEDLEAQVTALIKGLDLDEMISRSLVYMKVFGMSLLHLPLPNQAGALKNPPNVNNLGKLVDKYRKKVVAEDGSIHYTYGELLLPSEALSRYQIKDYETSKDDLQPELWEVYTGEKNTTKNKTKMIHRDRVVHMANWWLSDDPWGTSEFLPQYDVLTDLENINLAMVEAYTKMAVGIAILHVPPDATDEDFQWAQDNWVNIDLMSEFILPQRGDTPESQWKAEVVSWGGKGADPKPFMEQIWDRMSSVSRMSKTILRGTEAGKLTGSELNYKEYYAVVEEIRKDITRYYNEVICNFQEWGYLDPGEIYLEWKPIDQPTKQEAAKTAVYESQAFKIAVEATNTLKDLVGGEVVYHQDETYVVYTNRDKQFIGIRSPLQSSVLEEFKEGQLPTDISSLFPDPNQPEEPTPPPDQPPEEVPPGDLPPEDGASAPGGTNRIHSSDKVKLTSEQWDEVKRVWADPYVRLLNAQAEDMLGPVNEGIDFMVNEYIEEVTEIMEANGVPANKADYDVGPIITEATQLQFDDDLLRKNVEAELQAALQNGWEETALLLDLPVEFSVGMPWAAEFITTNTSSFTYSLTNDLSFRVVTAMQEGLTLGEGYKEIARRIKGVRGSYRDSTYKAVHRVCHSALNAARINAAVEDGSASKTKKLVYITMGDNKVRPEHEAREGQLYPPDEMEVLLSEWNCRCTCAPTLAIEQVIGRSLTQQELGG